MRHQVYLDTLTLGALGFGMVLLVMEDARRVARESEERLQTLIASTTDALLLLDSRLRVQAANPAAERLFDASAATMRGTRPPVTGGSERCGGAARRDGALCVGWRT